MDIEFKPPIFGSVGTSDNNNIDLNDIFSGYFFNFEEANDWNENLNHLGAGSNNYNNFIENVEQIQNGNSVSNNDTGLPNFKFEQITSDEFDGEPRKRKASTDPRIAADGLTDQQRSERRERNREHAKRSRVRKKFLLECLQEQLVALRKENMNLRQVVKEHMPDVAVKVFEKFASEKAVALSTSNSSIGLNSNQPIIPKKPNCLLVEPDFQLISALMDSQQNFTVSDPSLPDNPIVYASQGFLNLTGYTIDKVIGRNCRFLQGPGTNPRSVDIIRRGVAEGRDTSVCLLNYKADGSPFWNQFFVAALCDEQGKVVNYVGVQALVKQARLDEFKDKLKKIPLPEHLMSE